MKRFLLSWIILTVLCMGSFLIQTPVSFAQKMTKEAPLGVAGGTLNGIIWESSDQLAFSVSDITSGSGSLEVDIGGGVTRSDVVGLSHFLADSSGFATGDVSVSGGYCTGLSVRVYDGGAGTSFTIPIPSCPSQNSDPITQKYIALGGPSSFLGYPATRENHTPTTTGLYQHFLGTGNAGGGSIYWSPSTGAQSVHGLIGKEWANLGWEQSFLGFPTTDESGTPDGIGRYNDFQYGSIYWSPSTGAHEVHGRIQQEWARLGGEQSFLGFPTTDESATQKNDGRYNHFQGGSIFWSPPTDAHEVHGFIRNYWASRGWELSCFGYPSHDEQPSGSGRLSWFQNGNWIYWSKSSGIKSSC